MKTKMINLLIIVLLVLSEIWSAKIVFILVSIHLLWMIYKQRFIVKMPRTCIPLLLIVAIGVIGGICSIAFFDIEINDFTRDIYNTITPVIYIVYGVYLRNAKKVEEDNLYKGIIASAGIIAFRHYILLILNFGQDIRGIAGNGSFVTIVALFVILLKREEILENKFLRYILLIFLFISDILYLSRTDIVIIGTFAFICAIYNKEKRLTNFVYLIVSAIVIVVAMLIIVPKESRNVLINKISRSFIEISPSSENEWTWENINWNWRGYEIYRMQIHFKGSNLVQKIFGSGYGTLLDLNTKIKLGQYEYTKISVLHNGYCYILLKTGIVGIGLYLYTFIYLLYDRFKRTTRSTNIEDKIISSIALSNIIITYFVAGIYNGGSIFIFCVLLGFCSKMKKENKNDNNIESILFYEK